MGRVRDTASDVGPALAAELLEAGHELVLRARGVSMSPLIRDGDLLTLAGCARAPRPGQLVAAISSRRLLVHRVVRARAGQLLLQGDALWQPDGWFACQYLGHHTISPEACDARIIGRVVVVERDGRRLGAWRIGGPIARAWSLVAPLVRALRGAARRVRARPAPRLS